MNHDAAFWRKVAAFWRRQAFLHDGLRTGRHGPILKTYILKMEAETDLIPDTMSDADDCPDLHGSADHVSG